jgi:hypothetical protein
MAVEVVELWDPDLIRGLMDSSRVSSKELTVMFEEVVLSLDCSFPFLVYIFTRVFLFWRSCDVRIYDVDTSKRSVYLSAF